MEDQDRNLRDRVDALLKENEALRAKNATMYRFELPVVMVTALFDAIAEDDKPRK